MSVNHASFDKETRCKNPLPVLLVICRDSIVLPPC